MKGVETALERLVRPALLRACIRAEEVARATGTRLVFADAEGRVYYEEPASASTPQVAEPVAPYRRREP